MKRANGRRTAPQIRVVQSLHLSKPQHTTWTKAAKLSGESLAQFIRSAADQRAAVVMGDQDRPQDLAA